MKAFAGIAVAALVSCWSASAVAVETARIVDLDGKPVANAVVFLSGSATPALAPPQPVVVDQVDKQFVPRISVIRTGTEVIFPNSDAVSHHVYSFANPNNFELPLYQSKQQRNVMFEHAGLVTLGCNIHDSMLGYILVVDTPFFAVANEAGEFDFAWEDQLTEATTLRIWSPELADGQIQDAFRKSPRQFMVSQRQSAGHDLSDSSLDWSDY